jgi:redox-sensitive bicupin YhaK (pirin superfamily)
MSNTGLIVEERSRDIGDFLVGRLLPFKEKRMVGPFIFIDHMGPATSGNGKYFDIDPHPHIGLSTLTYLFDGEIMHRDSIGSEQRIKPGAVNWMTAGKFVVHTEKTPDDFRDDKERKMHGFQIWVALPKHLEDMEPEFFHANADDLPFWQENNIDFKLIAGEAYGRKSPVPVYSPLFMIELKAKDNAYFDINSLKGECGVCVVEGSLKACDQEILKGNMLIAKQNEDCGFSLSKGSHVLIFGGEPLPEERFIFWNYVSSDREKIRKANEDWQSKIYPKVKNDEGYIPSPATPEKFK